MKTSLIRIIVTMMLTISSFGISACGSGSGSTSYFKTVTVAPVGTVASTTSTVLQSGNTSDVFVTVTLQSTAYPDVVKPSPVTVVSSTIRYYKTGNSPSYAPATLPDQAGPAGQIPAGGSLVFSFDTASGIFKNNLVANSGFVSGQPWQYNVRYYFSLVEDYTNTTITSIVDGGTITFQ